MKKSIFGFLVTLFILVLIMVYPAQATLELVGPTWQVVEINGSPVSCDQSKRGPNLVFSGEGRVSGSTGCNRFTGTYTQDGNSLKFAAMAMTKMACPPPLDALERSFLQATAATASVRKSGETLELLDAGGKVQMRLQSGSPS
jgi:heat shock protein HslJ